MLVAGGDDPADILDAMKTRTFGATDLRCSEIGFGTWALGSTWWGKITSGEGENLLRRALDLGVTFFDTGNVYGLGANEEIVRKALEGVPRDAVQISTKFGYVLDEVCSKHPPGIRRIASIPSITWLNGPGYSRTYTFPA